jgi:hypothetical protein
MNSDAYEPFISEERCARFAEEAPKMKGTLDNASLAVTLDMLAEFCHEHPGAGDWTEKFLEVRDQIALR